MYQNQFLFPAPWCITSVPVFVPQSIASDNDVIINNGNSTVGPPGPAGPPGPTGPVGPAGPPGPAGESSSSISEACDNCKLDCKLITEDYQAIISDSYLGVDSKDPITITLPSKPDYCKVVIIKAEMGPPLGNRKITVITSDGSNINGNNSYIITIPYGRVSLIWHNNNWWTI